MGKRLVSLLTALALAVSAFAGLTVAPAGAAPDATDTTIYFPFVPNDDEIGGTGPWFGAVTVHNPEPFAINVTVRRADGAAVAANVPMQPFSSKTWNSAQIFGDNPGGGVSVTAAWVTEAPLVTAGICTAVRTRTFTVTRGNTPNTTDIINLGTTLSAAATVVVNVPGAQTPGDYTVQGNVPGSTQIGINWGPAGIEPGGGSTYTVTITLGPQDSFGNNCPPPRIHGVVKTTAPVASTSGRTSAQHEMVSGYSSLPQADLQFVGAQGYWNFPIVQTNNGWNSVLHITNFSNVNACGVTVTLYQAETGYSDPSFGQFIELLNAGETWHLDLAAEGVPAGWVGTAFVSADCGVLATVDRIKATQPWGDPVNMAITNQAQPVNGAAVFTVTYAPLVFQRYNGWNTGLSIVNLSAAGPNQVQVTFYNTAGTAVHSETRTIQPRAMEFVYRPEFSDVGIGGLAQAEVRSLSGLPIAVAVDEVKYSGTGQDIGQAMSYLGTRPAVAGEVLGLPLFQKQGQLSGGNDNSGVALFNVGSDTAEVLAQFTDSAGAPVAPTVGYPGPVFAPIRLSIPPKGGIQVYAPWYGEMPGGFQGSFWAVVADDGFAGAGPAGVAAVSNNVNYDVQFDGSAAFNLGIRPVFGTLQVTRQQQFGPNDGNVDWTVQVTLSWFGQLLANVPITFQIVDNTADANFVDTAGAADADNDWPLGNAAVPALTNANGQLPAAVNVFLEAGNPGQTYTINAFIDVDRNGTPTPGVDILIGSQEVTV